MKKTLVCAFGRANIFHKGHMALVSEIERIAKQHDADPAVFLSHTENKKNPLPYDVKVKLMNKWTHGTVKLDPDTKVKIIGNLLHYANEHNYENIIIVCGSDRYPEYSKSLPAFAESRDYFKFKSVKVMALQRDPDADANDAASMSGSAMRKYVTDNDFESFRKSLPDPCTDAEAKIVWKLAQKGLGVKGLAESILSYKEFKVLNETE